MSRDEIRKKLAVMSEDMDKFLIESQWRDRPEIDYNRDQDGNATPEGMKQYSEEMARREKEDAETRPALRSTYFQKRFSDLQPLMNEVFQSWPETKSLYRCDPIPFRMSLSWISDCAESLRAIVRKIRD